MPDAMGLPPGFMGLLALAIGFPRTCGQKKWLSPKWVTPGEMEGKKEKGGHGENEAQVEQQKKSGEKRGTFIVPRVHK